MATTKYIVNNASAQTIPEINSTTIISETISASTISFSDGTIQTTAYLGTNNITSPLNFPEGSQIESTPENSGDGSGLTTLSLKPDVNTDDDRYIVLDPTGPNHIHIRAGGTIDESNADLIIGGEKTNVIVSDSNQGVYINTERIIETNSYYFTPDNGFSTAEWSTDEFGNHRIIINDPIQDVYDATWRIYSPSIFAVVHNGNYVELNVNGTSTPGMPQPITIYVLETPPVNPTTLEQVTFIIRESNDSSIEIHSDININASDDLRIYSYDRFLLRNYATDEPIEITTNYDNEDHTWYFQPDGTLQFPDGTVQSTAYQGSSDSISSGPSAPGSAVVANPTNVNINFSDGIGTAWSFSPTGMTFPDDTIQTTAYPGPLKYYAEVTSRPPQVSPVAIGDRAVAIGDGAKSISDDTLSFGTESGPSGNESPKSIFLGVRSGYNSFNVGNSIFLGENSGGNSTGNTNSVFLGFETGYESIESYSSVFIGNSVGFSGQNNYNCVFIGNECGYNSQNNFNSIFIGDNSGQSSETCGSSIFLGNGSGRGQSGATFSICLGQNSANAQGGKYLGNNNIIIGNYVMLPTGSTNSLNIGNVIYGKNIYDFDPLEITFSAQTEGKIGIGVVDPTARLHLGKSTTLSALMRLEVGPAPTTPNDGDIWLESNTSTGLKIRVSGVTRTIQTTDVPTLYLLEAYANVTYTLPSGFTDDPCRYSIVNNTVNVPSGWFDTTGYTFTPQKAGYWEITASYDVYRNSEASIAIRKNGGVVAAAGSFNSVAQQVTKIVYLNGSTDFIDVINTGGAQMQRSQFDSRSWFQARWVGE